MQNFLSFQKKGLLAIIVLIIILCGIWLLGKTQMANEPTIVACTMEAKICPDGSAVGRGGPKCEFAECPSVTTEVGTIRMGETKVIGGVSIQILGIEEDSRCPLNAQCIQAGTVRLAAKVGGGDVTLSLDAPAVFSQGSVALSDVKPVPMVDVPRKDSDYEFTLTVYKR